MGSFANVFLSNYWVDLDDLSVYRRLNTSLRATIIFQVYTVTNFGAKAELLTPTPRRLNSAKKSLVTHYNC